MIGARATPPIPSRLLTRLCYTLWDPMSASPDLVPASGNRGKQRIEEEWGGRLDWDHAQRASWRDWRNEHVMKLFFFNHIGVCAFRFYFFKRDLQWDLLWPCPFLSIVCFGLGLSIHDTSGETAKEKSRTTCGQNKETIRARRSLQSRMGCSAGFEKLTHPYRLQRGR